jgi:hypothetical protein
MQFRRFGLGRFFGWFLIGFKPLGVEYAGLIDSLVSVGAEEIALCLQEIRR